MARRRSRRNRQERDHNTISNLTLRPANLFIAPRDLSVSDRRFFHPHDPIAPLFSNRRDQRRVVDVNVNRHPERAFSYKSVFGFKSPGSVHVCVRRKQRREVLFALRRTGKGSRSRKHRNQWSDVEC